MAERPNLISQSERSTSDRASRLAERFGMTRADMEGLLTETHAEYPNAPLPPATLTPHVPIERAAETITTPPASSTPAPVQPQSKPLSGGFIAGLFTVLLIGLGIALSFHQGCFQQRHEISAAKPVDTVQNMLNNAAEQASTPRPPTNVPPGEVPPESLVVPREEPPGTSGQPSNSGSTTESQAKRAAVSAPRPVLQTSSEFEAEERLAELRADGNSHARIRVLHKSGRVAYQVVAR